MIQEKILIMRFNRGDQTALRDIYTLYKDRLVTLAGALLHDRSAAEDAVHDVFAKLIRNQDSLTVTKNLKQYLMTSVVNTARQRFHRRKRDAAASLDCVADCPAGDPAPQAAAVFDEQMQHLEAALAALPYEQREVVLMRHYSGLRFKKIATLQDASVNTVQARYRYGLDKLRSLLNGELEK